MPELRTFLSRLVPPPHIGWPLLVVAILLMSFTAMTVTILAANADGGVQVVADYHQPVDHEARRALQAASDALGWNVSVDIQPVQENALRPLVFTLTDRDGRPVTDLTGSVELARPHRAQSVTTLPLVPVAGQPGQYRVLGPVQEPGLWDLHLDVQRGTDHFLHTLRRDVTR